MGAQFKFTRSNMKTLVVLPYAAGYAAYPYAAAPVIAYAPLESGLVYPAAVPYVHDPAGDSSDDSYPEASPMSTTQLVTPRGKHKNFKSNIWIKNRKYIRH